MLNLAAPKVLAGTANVFWSTFETFVGANNEMFLYGLNVAGDDSASKLAANVYNGGTPSQVDTEGDFVELGYFASDAAGTPSATSADLFKGNFWIPLTSSTKIGMWSADGITEQNTAGRFMPTTSFDTTNDNAATFATSGSYAVTDTITDLNLKLVALDTAAAAAAGNDGYLAIRFYDVDPASTTVGGDKQGGDTEVLSTALSRYNTIASAAWKWTETTFGGVDTNVYLHSETDGNLNTLEYELPTNAADTGYDAAYAGVKIGTGGNALSTLSETDEKRVATIAYRDDTALNLANTGDTIVSMLDDDTYGTVANITGDTGTTRDLTIMARSAGTTYEYSGDITNKTDIFKIGAGEQAFTGPITTEGYLSIDEGTLSLNPSGAGTNQKFEYITDDGTPGALGIDNTNDSTHVVEIGFADVATVTPQTFAGTVALSGVNTTTIKVSSGRTDSDYGKEQVFSGVVSGDAKLSKTGVGRLNLTGSNTITGDVDVDDGTLVVGNSNALGQAAETTTVTINKGKLEVASGVTTTSDVTIQGGTGRNFIGGDGTVNSVVIGGTGGTQVDVVSPGQGISSSLSGSFNNKQIPRGNGDADASIGAFTATNLSLLDGGVYDWEIQDFEGDNTSTNDWDVLKFTTLTLGDPSSETFGINIFGIDPSDGSAGMPDFSVSPAGSKNLLYKTGSFTFLSGPAGGITWGGGGAWTSAQLNQYFVPRDDDFAYYNSYWGGDWTVSYNNGDFNLAFSAVPEPSTYVMVTGLLMLPGFQFLRRFRRRKDKGGE